MGAIVRHMQSNLRQCRESAGITGAALARKAGLSDATIRRAERGRVVTPTTLSRIMIAYNDLAPNGHGKALKDVFPDADA